MYMIAVQGGGGGETVYVSLDTKGEGVGGGSPFHGGDFLEIWVLNTGFWMRYKSLINIKS